MILSFWNRGLECHQWIIWEFYSYLGIYFHISRKAELEGIPSNSGCHSHWKWMIFLPMVDEKSFLTTVLPTLAVFNLLDMCCSFSPAYDISLVLDISLIMNDNEKFLHMPVCLFLGEVSVHLLIPLLGFLIVEFCECLDIWCIVCKYFLLFSKVSFLEIGFLSLWKTFLVWCSLTTHMYVFVLYILMYIVTLSTRARIWEQPKCPITDKWIKK